MFWMQNMVNLSRVWDTVEIFCKNPCKITGCLFLRRKKIKKLVKIKSICIFFYWFLRLWSWWLLLDVIWISRENAYKIALTSSEIKYKIWGSIFLKGTKIYHSGMKMHTLGTNVYFKVLKFKKLKIHKRYKCVPFERVGKISDKPF